MLSLVARLIPFISAKPKQDASNDEPNVQESGSMMSEVQMLKTVQVKSKQLDQKEHQETLLLKEEIERMTKKLVLTTSSLEETLDCLNRCRAEKNMLNDLIIVKDNQLHQLSTERVQLAQQLHEAARERNMLIKELDEANRENKKQSRMFNENMKDHREMSTALNYDLSEARSKGFIFKAERDILMKRYKELSANLQAVNEQLYNMTNKHNQIIQDLQSSTQRNKILEKMVKMSIQYSKMYKERNDLQIIATMKFDDVKLGSPTKEDSSFITLNKSLQPRDEMISQFINGAMIKQ